MTETAARKPAARITAFDGYRGIGIILVVVAHAAGLGWGFQGEPGGAFNFYYSVFMRVIVLCALPIFLFASGYWFANVEVHSTAEYFAFLRKRVSRIAVPYLLWSVVFLSWTSIRTGFSPGDFLFKLALGQADAPFYFIHLMIQFYALAPLFSRWSKSTRGIVILVALHALILAGWYAVRFHYPELEYWKIKLPFFTWLSIFPLGMYFRHNPRLADRLGYGVLTAGALLSIILMFLETAFLFRQGFFAFAISDIRLTSFLYSAFVLLLLFRLREREWPRVLVKLGEYSFGIFFIHGFFLRGFDAVFSKFLPALVNFQPAYQALVSVSIFAATCTIVYTGRRVLGLDRASKLLGF